MLRYPKFRAWDIDDKVMRYAKNEEDGIYSTFYIYENGEWELVGVSHRNNLPMDDDEVILEEGEGELMQVTGFNDKHGTEIYFEDIVKFSFHDVDNPEENYEGTARIVETLNHGVGIHIDWQNGKEMRKVWAVTDGGLIQDLWDDDALWTVEVIGNIYENPGLLK